MDAIEAFEFLEKRIAGYQEAKNIVRAELLKTQLDHIKAMGRTVFTVGQDRSKDSAWWGEQLQKTEKLPKGWRCDFNETDAPFYKDNQTEYKCDVCQDDPVQCGALPSLRHCPEANQTGAENDDIIHDTPRSAPLIKRTKTFPSGHKVVILAEWYYEELLKLVDQHDTAPNPQPVSAALEDCKYLAYFLKCLRDQNKASRPETDIQQARVERIMQALAQAGGRE